MDNLPPEDLSKVKAGEVIGDKKVRPGTGAPGPGRPKGKKDSTKRKIPLHRQKKDSDPALVVKDLREAVEHEIAKGHIDPETSKRRTGAHVVNVERMKSVTSAFDQDILQPGLIPSSGKPRENESDLLDRLIKEGAEKSDEDKNLNTDPVDVSHLYRGSANVPNANAKFEFTADMVLELKKCREDVLYFAQNYFYIINLDEGKKTKIKLYAKQKRALKMMRLKRWMVLLASRQSGKSTLLTIYALWVACFLSDQTIVLIANKESTAINVFKRIRMAYEQLPNFIKPGVKDYAKTGMTLANDSSIMVSTTTATAIRGLSINCVDGKHYVWVRNTYGTRRPEKFQLKKLWIKLTKRFTPSEGFAVNDRYEILTRNGWSRFRGIQKTSYEGPVVAITTSDPKRDLRCTSDHLIAIKPEGCASLKFIQAKDLTADHTLVTNDTQINIVDVCSSDMSLDVYDVVGTQDSTFFANDILVHNCLLIDELGFIAPEIVEDFWSSVIPTISSGKKTKIFVASTPNGTTTPYGPNKFYEIYSGAEKGENGWAYERIDWHDIPGRDENWRKAMVQVLGSEEKFLQEFGNVFLDSGITAIGAEVIEKFKKNKKAPIFEFEDGDYRIYEKPEEDRLYVIGVDVGEGIGRASSVAQILDVTDLKDIRQVGVYGSAIIEPYMFGAKLVALAKQWGNPPMLVERNNCGAQVIDALFYKHMYERVVSYNKVTDKNKYLATRNLGVLSHTNVRFTGIQNMRYWVDHLKVVSVNCPTTIAEFETFVRQANGVFGKKTDKFFDDRILSLAWALFGLHEDVAAQCFEIQEYDALGKPCKIVHNTGFEKHKPTALGPLDVSIVAEAANAESWFFGEEEETKNPNNPFRDTDLFGGSTQGPGPAPAGGEFGTSLFDDPDIDEMDLMGAGYRIV